MDDFDKDLVLQWYEELEDEMLDIMRYLPPAPENLKSFSPRLASLIMDACGLLDSILRQITPDPVTVDGKSITKKELNIIHYGKLYAAKFELPDMKSITLISPPKYHCPFAPWVSLASDGPYEPLPWWATHTDLKHDRIANLKKAGLGMAMEALCALHQIIAVVPDLARSVLRRGWVRGEKEDLEFVIEILEGKSFMDTVLIETKLFVVPRGQRGFPENIEDFRPIFYPGSERLVDFFGRW